MGIHYDYKSKRGERAMLKEAKRKARLVQRRAKRVLSSDPEEKRFIWAYHIKIENFGDDTVKLVSRSWTISDSMGRVQEVQGAGVVGENPILKPGTSFEYTSGTPLNTPSGFMMGTYKMKKNNGSTFNAHIPAFSLDSPHEKGLQN